MRRVIVGVGRVRRGVLTYRPIGSTRKGDGMSDSSITVREAGRRGGRSTVAKYGSEFMARNGQKGGQALHAKRGREFFSEIGKLGGIAVKEKYGAGYYAAIGRKGGLLMSANGSAYFSEIGKKGAEARRARAAGER